MAISIVDLNGVGLESAPMLGRDCSFPITNMWRFCPPDQVLQNMPVYLGDWADGMAVPLITGRSIEVDGSLVVDECDTAVVTANLTGCELVAPDQGEISIKTDPLKWIDLIPAFCRSRNIDPSKKLGPMFNSDGSLNTGNEYAIDFARFTMAILSQTMMELTAKAALIGDEALPLQFDGFYNQLDNGWGQGSPSCGSNFNTAVVLDWAAATGVANPTPDTPVKVGGYAWSAWGNNFTIPAGITLAEFLEDYWIDAVQKTWAENMGGVTMWEAHVRTGASRCLPVSASCMRPCEAQRFDNQELRDRYARLVNARIVELYPSGTTFPMLESRYVPANTMYFGPREVGGNPTYGIFFKNIDALLRQVGVFGETYGQGFGFQDNEPLFPPIDNYLPSMFEDSAVYWDISKVNGGKCVEAMMMLKAGVLATARHLWLKVTNVYCTSMVTACADVVTVDFTPPEPPEENGEGEGEGGD